MWLFFVLMLCQTQEVARCQFNMYNTDYDRDGYCLLYYPFNDFPDDFFQSFESNPHQIIPYCLRLSEESVPIASFESSTAIASVITFAELREQNITSDLLISWSAPIEQAELYEAFLNETSNSSLAAKVLFYNCTFPWFGPFCRFAFDTAETSELFAIVYWNLFSKMGISNRPTCYMHLTCSISPICLDWRELCDGKVDCLDGSDEVNCWQLEMNECNKNEYRCYNGQCIPGSFFHDDIVNPDCLDRTDEYKTKLYPSSCSFDPTFRCEEHRCHPGAMEFACDDGRCQDETEKCFKTRHIEPYNDLCSNAMHCFLGLTFEKDYEWCEQYCSENTCIEDYCPPLYQFPPGPIFYGHVIFIFAREEVILDPLFSRPKYVCYNEDLCADFLPATVHLNGSTCRYFNEFAIDEYYIYNTFREQMQIIKKQFHKCSMITDQKYYLNQTMMYRCQNSTKYISKYRLLDRTLDCPFGDDETFNNQSCLLNDSEYRIHCSISNDKVCFAPFIASFDRPGQYVYGCDMFRNVYQAIEIRGNHINFQAICDGLQDLLPILIDGQNETDETGCEYWPCNNTYTRCDKFWSCQNGADEVNCPSSTCPEFYHACVFLNDSLHVSCLHMNRTGDGIIDCLGATDEPNRCLGVYPYRFGYNFNCMNDTKCLYMPELCNGRNECHFGDDELFCNNTKAIFAQDDEDTAMTDAAKFLRVFFTPGERDEFVRFFTVRNIQSCPSQLNLSSDPLPLLYQKRMATVQESLMVDDKNVDMWRCNRGLRIFIRTGDDTKNLSCLCPPSYYGDQCQYQNQRVSLTVQIRATLDFNTLFTLLIFLIDDEANIESHDYIEYLPSRDCNIKFNVYLLYFTRPKDPSKNYSIRIDAFNRMEMNYRASWLFPVQFPFLPVHRIAVRLIIPPFNAEPLLRCPSLCMQGQCFNFVNDPNSTICRCYPGWSGLQCSKRYQCDCETNSQCIDKSICLCPIGRYGPRCYLFQSSCHQNSCANGGLCVHDDERYTYAHINKTTCICPPEYTGDYCEIQRTKQTQIDISFDDSLSIPSSLTIHFVQVHNNSQPNQTSMMKKIGFDETSLTFYTPVTFHLAFAEMLKTYYLIILQQQLITSSHIGIKIIPSRRCASINELFNETIIRQDLLRRIKLYHIPCREHRELVCFYDSTHFCLCDRYRHADCFQFDYNVSHNCDEHNFCENGGQCFIDDRICPKLATCACNPCYFGSRCQFSTERSTLLLDIILGYRIRLNTGIQQQPSIVKFAIAFTIFILILGLISNGCTFLTFQMKKTRDVGCGIYLYVSSIVSLTILIVLAIKVCFLLLSQFGSIKARSFMQVQCISIDFFLRVLIASGDWIYACVSIERSFNILKGVRFNKPKSKQFAKWAVISIFIFTCGTHIHDPIYRRLVHDEEEQRTWCITAYSSFLQTFDRIVNIIHLCVPFLINFLSGIVIITMTARTRSNAHENQSYRHFLYEQFQRYKHLLLSSMVLVILAIPRVLIAFLSGCMKSSRQSWIYLIGYYSPFVPLMLTFIIFVLPSKLYKTEFKKSIKRFLSH